MRTRSLAAQHDAAVARRLEFLTTDLDAVRERGRDTADARLGAIAWSAHGQPRVRVVPDLDEPTNADDDRSAGVAAPPLPTMARAPGRHASRRRPASWVLGLPDALRGRVALGPGQLAVVAVLAVVALVVTCWWLVRGDGHEVTAPTALATPRHALVTPGDAGDTIGGTVGGIVGGATSGATGAGTSAPSEPTADVVVDVAGKVRDPGIAVLHQGARVIDALRAAGGVRPGVDLSGLNLARVLTDGEQVVVGVPTVAGPAPSGPASGSPVTGLVNINTADETTLESLPDVGPVTAQAILTWRSQHGGFTSVDQLLDVDGIGDVTLAKLTPYVTI
jgi:competence protein ComEA